MTSEASKSTFSDSRTRTDHRPDGGGHSPKKTNNRVATAKKLSVACPRPHSKVRALGARDLCAPQNKPHIDNNNATGRRQTSMLYAAQR